MATCNICHAQYNLGEHPCWRCKQDNRFWENQRGRPRWGRFKDFFGNVWGVIAVVINLFALILLVWITLASAAWAYPDIESGLMANRVTILGQFLAWFMSFISMFVIYAVRFELWNYSWVRHVMRRTPPNLYVIAVTLFLLGIFLLLVYMSASILLPSAPRQLGTLGVEQSLFGILFQKIVMPAMYGFLFAFFTAGSMFMSAGLFVDRMNEHVGQPIFMNTRLLADLVQRSVEESLELPPESTRLSSIKRVDQGGIKMIVRYTDSSTPRQGANAVEKRFTVEANKWGQIDSLVEEAKSNAV